MRLKSLYVENYKNLKGCTLNFSLGNGLSMIVGNNGSGKSNVLELISAIFHDAYRKTKFKIRGNYRLIYSTTEGNEVIIQRNNGRRSFLLNNKIVNQEYFIENNCLPSNVIGIYSGEESRLWNEYYSNYYKSYIRRIEENSPLSKMRLMFINKYYWNIALLTLLLSNNDTLTPFIRDELNITCVNNIIFTLNMDAFYKSTNEPLKAFIKRFNPSFLPKIEIPYEKLKEMLFFDKLVDENGKEVFNEDDEYHLVDNGLLDSEIFNYFIQGNMPKKNKIIINIEIIFNGYLTTEQLSEGEKKLILIKSVLEFIADERSLLLLDEPDAHIHEARKKKLYDTLLDYVTFNRQVILSTHSPTLAQNATQNQLLMLENNSGTVKPLDTDKVKKIQKLAADNWSVIEQSIIFNSADPLIVFEGKTDVKYVKRAFELLGQVDDKYRRSIDIVSSNGSGNTQFFINDLLGLSPNKRIIAIFDRDSAGRNGAASVFGISKDAEEIVKYKELVKENITTSFIPYRVGITEGDFLIEDYFLDSTIESIVNELIPVNKNPVKNLPNLAKRIKVELENKYHTYSLEEFKGFIPLLDMIIKHVTEGVD